MDASAIHRHLGQVKAGRMSRRAFVRLALGAGLTLPVAGMLMLHAGIASGAERQAYKPTKRGGGGLLKLLLWQGPTILNPHLATGVKDVYGARLFYQSLAEWDMEGNLIPILAAGIPTVENGGVDPGGRWVVWNLKPNVAWHDGAPFTADDLVFNQEYCADPATAAFTVAAYRGIRVEKLGPHKARVVFDQPTPFWADPFVGRNGLLIPKHLFERYRGAKSREAPANSKPVGLGPFRFVSFVPGDLLRGAIHAGYHEPNRPFFDAVEIKGGGDAVSAARAVLQTGEFDYAYNLQVEDEILRRLESGGKGRVAIFPTGNIEHIRLNAADPWTEVEGERGHPKSRHPILSDGAVREAFSLAIDRKSIQEHIYGRTAEVSANFLNQPARFRSKNATWEFNVDKANRTLEAAGWKRGTDGIRGKDGRKLKLLFQTSTNAPRQKTQAIIKQACGKAGFDLELKSIPASVFFAADPGNADTLGRFSADIEMYNTTIGQPDPGFFMAVFLSREAACKANKWIGRNSGRWQNAEYDRLHAQAEGELDPARRAELYIRMNDLVVGDRYVIPLVNRSQVLAIGKNLRAQFSGWSSDVFLIQDWYRE
jgi:peptide/nickel transport system substrate-binding protein